MRKVIDHSDAVHFTTHFGATAHAFETGQRGGNFLAPNSPRIGGHDCREAIAHIEFANQRR